MTETREAYVATALSCNAHAIERHGKDALEIVEAYNAGAKYEVYESLHVKALMIVLRLWKPAGLIFETRGHKFITAFYCDDRRLANIIRRDGYVRVREAG